MAELFTLTLGRDIEIWPEMQQQQPESSNRVTLQANTWRKRGNRNAQVAVTTRTHYCLTILQTPATIEGSIVKLESVKC